MMQLTGAVGNPSATGLAAPNHMVDQQIVAELLDVMWHPPLLPLVERLPPFYEGEASEMLCEEIARFQQAQGLDIVDGRVSVGWATWNALIERAQFALKGPVPPPVVLSLASYEVVELPRIASGLPSVTYSIEGTPCVLSGPGFTIELKVSAGSVKVDWGKALPLAISADPKTASLQSRVENGTASSTAGITLADESTRLQLESRAAIGSLFASVELSMQNGEFVLGGSLGDPQGFIYAGWDSAEQAAVYKAERQVEKSSPTPLGATVKLSGRLKLELKIKVQGAPDLASIGALIAVALPALVIGGKVVIGAIIELEGAGAILQLIARAWALIKLTPAGLQLAPN